LGSLTVGGTEKQVAMLAKGLKARGQSVDIFVLEKSGALVAQVEQAGIGVIDGGYRSYFSAPVKLIALLLCEVKLVWFLLRHRPDVVHGFLPPATFFSALAARLTFIRLSVISKRALGTHQDRTPALKWLDRRANEMAHIVTANSRAVARDTEARDGYAASRIVVIPNGLDFAGIDEARFMREDARNELGLSEDDIAIVMVANLIPYKGHSDLIQAFSPITSNRQLKMFFVGRDDGVGPSLMSLANKLGVARRIIMLGQRDDVPFLLSAMDIGVMASDQEGLSNAVLEKLASGLPVVATDIGGNAEALEGMPGCVLVRAHDPDDLARGISSVIQHLALDRGREARQKLARDRYSVASMVDAYKQLYGSACPASPRPT